MPDLSPKEARLAAIESDREEMEREIAAAKRTFGPEKGAEHEASIRAKMEPWLAERKVAAESMAG